MNIVSVGEPIENRSTIKHFTLPALKAYITTENVDYIIVTGGDGMLRRTLAALQDLPKIPPIILNPTGSFNVIAKLHRIAPLEQILLKLDRNETLEIQQHTYYRINQELFLFSAGNMGDLQHIFLSESLRFGWLKKGAGKYLLAFLALLPLHLIMTPFMLMSKSRFFIFVPAKFIKKIGSFYGRVPKNLHIDLGNSYNFIELDGDIVLFEERYLKIAPAGEIKLVIG